MNLRDGAAGRLATLALLLCLAACAPLGGASVRTAETDPGGGIGGTGVSAGESRSVGVLGTVRGFGSVLVNGVRIEAGADFPVGSPFGSTTVSGLAAGDVIEVIGTRTDDGVSAERMARLVALVGPVTGPLDSAARLRVMDVPVTLAPEAAVAISGGRLGLTRGRRVVVSGLWRNGEVVASRIEAAAARPFAAVASESDEMIAGVMGRADKGGARIGPLPMDLPAGADPADGGYAIAFGHYAEGRFVAARLRQGHPVLPKRLGRLSVEAYAGTTGRTPALHGLGLQVAPDTRLSRLEGGRGVFIGPLDGTFAVEHGVSLPESLNAQRQRLERLGDGLAPRDGVIETR